MTGDATNNEDSEELGRQSSLQRTCRGGVPVSSKAMAGSLVPDSLVSRVGFAGGGIRDNEESLAIPDANLDDLSFGEFNQPRLCRAIVVSEVVSQPQTHFLVARFISGCTRAREQGGECGGFTQGLYASVDYSSYDISAVR